MTSRQFLERFLPVTPEEVRDENHHRPVGKHLGGVADRRSDIGPAMERFEREEVANQSQRMPSALGRPNHVLDSVGEQQGPGPVLFAGAGQRQDGRDFNRPESSGNRLADPGRSRLIDHQEQREFALLGEGFDVGGSEPG